jgi:hypothetical protein
MKINLTKINSKDLLKESSSIASSEKNDCVVYAIATAFDMDYDTAHKEVAERFNREEGKGVRLLHLHKGMTEGTTLNGKTVSKVIKSPNNTYKVYGKIVQRQVRLSSFIKKNQEGTYVILTRNHALTLKNGTLVDNNTKTRTQALVQVAFKID